MWSANLSDLGSNPREHYLGKNVKVKKDHQMHTLHNSVVAAVIAAKIRSLEEGN